MTNPSTDTSLNIGYVETSDGIQTVDFLLKRANRHGLIAGATGTGKTVTLQVLAESFSSQGVPVFLADIKGDLSGISQQGKSHPKITERFEKLGLPLDSWSANPTIFWDVNNKQGHPVRATISDFGPTLLARLLDLNDTQEGILNIAFAIADDEGFLLLDLKDLRILLTHIADNAKALKTVYGNISSSSVGAIQRRLLKLQRSSAKHFFGEPMLKLDDLMQQDQEGRGFINVLVADKLYMEPLVYATLLLWLLSELFENLPEVGDLDKPKLILFFDEAHLMFKGAPKALTQKVEQVVRLIRSKGVGVYFISQSPADIPDSVLAQLQNRFQHALRAFTPKEQKAVKVAAESFRANPEFDTVEAISQLGVGEALVSTLVSKGEPSVVQRTMIRPPFSRIGPATDSERKDVLTSSPVAGVYDEVIDRKSAYEVLTERAEKSAVEAEKAKNNEQERLIKRPKKGTKGRQRQSVAEAFVKSVARSLGSGLGRKLVRGILGSLFKGR